MRGLIRSLRVRLVLGTAALTAVVVVLAGMAGWRKAREGLVAEFDATTEVRVRALADAVERGPDSLSVVIDAIKWPEYTRHRRPDLGGIWEAGGEQLLVTPAAVGMWPAMPEPTASAVQVELPNGRAGRMLVRELEPAGGGPPVVVAVARDIEPLEERVRRLEAFLVASPSIGALAVGSAAISAGVMALLVLLLLRPLGRLAERIAAIDPTRPRPIGPLGISELDPAVRTLDDLLRRLGEQREREGAFVADAAHELRTPLAAVRAALEAPAGAVDPLAEVRRLQRTLDDLLVLARLDAGAAMPSVDAVDLAGVVRQRWDMLADWAAYRGLWAELSIADAIVENDEARIDCIVRNLLENAVDHGDPGRLEISLRPHEGGWRLAVSNPCARLGPGDADRIFERFWRADTARSGGHAGLGMAIVRRQAEVAGCRVSVVIGDARFSAFLDVPAALPARAAGASQ